MANGDIVSVTINPTAWQAIVTISGMGPSGGYNMGFSEIPINTGVHYLFSFSQPKLKFFLTSSGYNDEGNPTGLSRIVYGTTGVRLPYPNENRDDQVVNGGNIDLKFSLSDYIYQKDGDIRVNIISGLYNSGSIISSGITNLSVANNSILAYPKVVANWTKANYDVISGSSFLLRCAAFHRSVQSGRMVRTVKFTAQDTGNNVVTGWVTTPTIDSTMPDQVKVIEYVCTLSSANLAQWSPVSGNFVAYPWYGDTGSIVDTSDRVNTGITPLYSTLMLYCNKNNTGIGVAIVNSLTGNNSLGQVINLAQFNPLNPPAAYLTIGSAGTGIKNFNNTNYGRSDVGLGRIYLQSGNHAWIGQTISAALFGNNPDTYLTISSFPNELRSNVIITGAGGSTTIQEKIKFQNISISGINYGASTVFQDMDYLWFDNCYMCLTGINSIAFNPITQYTHNLMENMGQGIYPGAGINQPSLVRGNYLHNFNERIFVYTCVGNLRDGTSPVNRVLFLDGSGTSIANPDNSILAYNKAYNMNNAISEIYIFENVTRVHGIAVIQNVLETNASTGPPLGWMGSIGNNTEPFNNFLVWNNTFVGARQGNAYNDRGSTSLNRGQNWHFQNNISDDWGTKTDTHPDPAEDGNRTGNWSIVYSVGFAGTSKGYITTNSIFPQPYARVFHGINTSHVPGAFSGFHQYVAPGTVYGVGGSGMGDYNLQPTSPLTGLSLNWVLPYDIDGHPRGYGDPPGAYAFFIAPSGVIVTTGAFKFLRSHHNAFYTRNNQFALFVT